MLTRAADQNMPLTRRLIWLRRYGRDLRLSVATVAPQPNQSTRQGYVLVCGAGEHPGNVLLTSRYSTDLRRLGARVSMKLYPRQNHHTFPADFFQKLPLWCQFIRTPGAAMAF